MNKTPFEDFKKILENMTPEYKRKLVENFKKFANLKSACEAKGYIKILPLMRGIKVIKKTKEVRELKKVIDELKPGGFIWQDTATPEKKSKR